MNLKYIAGNLTGITRNLIVVAFLFSFALPKTVSGQRRQEISELQTSKTYLVKLKDGSELIGILTSRDSVSISISTKSIPAIQIPVDKIKRMDLVDSSSIKKGRYWFPNPNSNRYIFGPSAYNLKKGEGYYQNTLLFLNSFGLGITDHVSVGGGVEFLSTVSSITSGNFNPIFYLTTKAGFKISDKLRAATGIMTLSIPAIGDEDRHWAGMAYGLGTYGSADHNLTGGLSWGMIDGDFSPTPAVNLSGMTRIARRTALITENWLIPEDGLQAVYMYGIRFFGEKISVDLAFLNNKEISQELTIGVPIVDFVIKF